MKVAVLLCVTGCLEPIPRAIVHARDASSGLGHAVLVLPTMCVTELANPTYYCSPIGYANPNVRMPGEVVPVTYAALIDPALHLKLEFAGYTLAEAAAMQVTTGDRVEHLATSANNGRIPSSSTGTQVTAGTPLLELEDVQIANVARSLELSGIVSSVLRVHPAEYGGKRFELTVTLYELDRPEPAWTVTCNEMFLDSRATSSLLANCVGNGILAVFAPGNLMGKPL